MFHFEDTCTETELSESDDPVMFLKQSSHEESPAKLRSDILEENPEALFERIRKLI